MSSLSDFLKIFYLPVIFLSISKIIGNKKKQTGLFLPKGMAIIPFLFLGLFYGQLSGQQKPNINNLMQSLTKPNQNNANRLVMFRKLMLIYKNNPDSMYKYAKMGLLSAEKQKSKNDLTFMQLNLSIALMNMAKNAQAIKGLEQAEANTSVKDEKRIMGSIYRIRGLSLYNLGKCEAALKNLTAAIDYYQKEGKWLDIPMCYSIMSSIFSENNNLDQSLVYSIKALNLINELINHPKWKYTQDEKDALLSNYLDFNVNLGNFYTDNGKRDYKKALKYYNLAIKSSGENKNMSAHIIFLANAAGVYFELKNKKLAEKMALRALSLSRKFKLMRQEANALGYLGYFSSNEVKSMDYFKQAFKICRLLNDKYQLQIVLKNKATKAEEFGNYKTALNSYKEYQQVNDSLTNINQFIKIANLESNFKLRESELKVKNLELDNFKKGNMNCQYLFVGFFIISLTVLFILFNLRLRKLNRNLTTKSRELEELNAFKSKVFFILGHDVSGALSGMSGILYLLSNDGRYLNDYDALIERLILLKDSALDMLNKLFMWGAVSNFIGDKTEDFSIPGDILPILNISRNLALAKQVELEINHIEDFIIQGNVGHIEFIIRNLLGNAIKFSPPGETVTLHVNHTETEVVISVKNKGVGIAQEDIPFIFSGKLKSSSGTRGEKGAGVGLMLCKKIAEMDKYRLELESKVNDYVLFSLHIPYSNTIKRSRT